MVLGPLKLYVKRMRVAGGEVYRHELFHLPPLDESLEFALLGGIEAGWLEIEENVSSMKADGSFRERLDRVLDGH